MMETQTDKTLDQQRRDAWMAAKVAVRCYAREPSDLNAGKVEYAWRKLRGLVTRAVDRRIAIELSELHRRQRYR